MNHKSCSYIYDMMFLTVFKIKHKFYMTSGSAPPPPNGKFWVCTSKRKTKNGLTTPEYPGYLACLCWQSLTTWLPLHPTQNPTHKLLCMYYYYYYYYYSTMLSHTVAQIIVILSISVYKIVNTSMLLNI